MQSISVLAPQRLAASVEVRAEVEATCAELRRRQEEAGEGNPARIDIEIVGDRPASSNSIIFKSLEPARLLKGEPDCDLRSMQ